MAERKSKEQSLSPDLSTNRRRAELLAELKRIRAMTPPREPGVTYPTAEELIRKGRDINCDPMSSDE